MTRSLELKPGTRRNLQEILEITVQTTRKILKCDRVVVYDASQLPQAEVLAESVASEYVAILGKVIEDPFLTEEYLDLYCYGRAVTIDKIESANLKPSQLEPLKQLEVTGLAIAPIATGNELSALLVAHQCSGRSWHSETDKLLMEKANTASYALTNIIQAEPKIESETETSTMAPSTNGNGNRNILPNEQAVLEARGSESTEVIERISHELGRENILNTTVREVRQLLQCDRVVVYSLDKANYGVVVAESVAAGWTQALGRMIDDPCIAERYLAEYRNGRVRAIDNIYGGKVSPCYVEQLEELEVKANLVAPIVSEGELFGLLIAHQCITPRSWQQQEISQITEVARSLGQTLEYSEVLTAVEEPSVINNSGDDTKWNERFTDAIQYIRQSITEEDVLPASVKEVRRVLECDRVVVYSLDKNLRYGEVIAESVAPGWTRALNKKIEDPCFEPTYRDKYLNGRVRAWGNIYESGLTDCYIRQLEDLEVKANLVAPIISEGNLFGLLVAHQCSDFRTWQEAEIRWTAQIATQVGFALDNAKLLADAKRLQAQLENEAKLTKYFTDAVRYIRESLQREDILEISVEEVRRVLNCDRVVVYSLDKNLRYGEVIAESVAPGWTRALNRKIDDPCFEPTYRDKYRDGRVRAWSNIYEAGMSKCYVEQLEKLEVKANLVTPVVSKGQLFGLLVAHQCSEFRDWQAPEIRWVTQIATQVGFALDNAKLLTDARQLQQQVENEGKWTEYFTDATQYIRQSIKTGDILKTSVKEVRRILDCDRVLVYSLDENLRYGEVIAESVAPGWTRALNRKIDDPCFETTHREQYRNGRVRVWNNIYEAGMTKCHIEQLERLEVKANLVTPIVNEGQLFGLLVAQQCSDFRNWQPPEVRWVTQIATQVGFALDNAKLLEQLQESHQQSDRLSHQRSEHTEALKGQVVEILADNGNAYQTLSQEAMRQSETTIEVLHQIQQVADSFKTIALSVQQIELQAQQNNLAVRDTQESLKRSTKGISDLQRMVQSVAVGFDRLAYSAQKLGETVNSIRDLSRQIVQQSMSITRVVNRSQIDAESQNSILDLSDTIFTLMQQLFEASARVEPLFVNIQTEVKKKALTLNSGTQQVVGTGDLQTVGQKLERVVALNQKLNAAIESISNSVENQTQSSTFAKDSVQEVAGIAERISEQSMTITQSFNQLLALVQQF